MYVYNHCVVHACMITIHSLFERAPAEGVPDNSQGCVVFVEGRLNSL